MSLPPKQPKLLDQLEQLMRRRRYAPRTIEAYRHWVRRFILFHGKRHPREMGAPEVEAFLSHLVARKNVAPSTQNQALSALLFLYRHLLNQPLPTDLRPKRSRKTPKQPTVLTPAEVNKLLAHLDPSLQLPARILYGSGLRLMECLSLRVKDVDFAYRTLTIHDGKGNKDRVVPLPQSLVQPLRQQIESVAALHRVDLAHGFGAAPLPYALQRKLPNAPKELRWQFLFPSTKLAVSREDGAVHRFHMSPSSLQKAVKAAAHRASLHKRVSCHTLRHSFATHLLQNGYDIRTVQELMGHKDVKTTMIYTHVLKMGGLAVRSPLDDLA